MSKRFFKVGGSLDIDLPSYVERHADKELHECLQNRDFCYVLAARQMGKSSLKVRVMNRLYEEGWKVASVDLTAFGTTGFTTSQWYASFLTEISDALYIDDEVFEDWWDAKQNLTPVARMSDFWEELLLKEVDGKIAIFIDEIDTLLSLDKQQFSSDDFFSAIRYTYNRRSKKPVFERLNFAVFGVAAPRDLMTDHERTPFNIGVSVKVENFSPKEAEVLSDGFVNDSFTNEAILSRILYWTAGQPFLTQKLGQQLSSLECSSEEVENLVDEAVKNTFFSSDILNAPHFSNIQTRILANENYNLRMLDMYKEVFQQASVNFENQGKENLYLKLSGLVKEQDGFLIVNNLIYRYIFNDIWLEKSYGTIKRPFTIDLQRWLKSDRSPDILLKGTLLEEAETWAASREDLTNFENEFLQASRLAEVKAKQEQILQLEKDRQRKKTERLYRASNNSIRTLQLEKINPTLALRIAELNYALFPESKPAAGILSEVISNFGKAKSSITIRKGHSGYISDVAFSPDGRLILTGSGDKTAKLWDISGRDLKTFHGHTKEIFCVAFSPDGKYVLTGSKDHTAKLWDLNGNEIHSLEGHTNHVLAIAFSPDGQNILTSSNDATLKLWNLDGEELRTITEHDGMVSNFAFSPDGQYVLLGIFRKYGKLIDIHGKVIYEFKEHKAPIYSVAFSPDGQLMLTGSYDKTIKLWDAEKKVVLTLKDHDRLSSVIFSPNGQILLKIHKDNKISLWGLDGKEIISFQGHDAFISSAAFSPDSNSIVTGSGDNSAKLWDLNGNEIQSFQGHIDEVLTGVVSPVASNILTGSKDGTARLWDLDGEEIQSFQGHDNEVLTVAFSHDGKQVLTGSKDGTARLWNLKGEEVQLYKGHEGEVSVVAFSHDGKYVITGSKDGIVRLWNLKGEETRLFNAHKNEVMTVFSAFDNKHLLIGFKTGRIGIWNLYSGEAHYISVAKYRETVTMIVFSDDGKLFLTSASDNKVKLWNLKGEMLQTFQGHSDEVVAGAFSSVNKYIMTGSKDKTVRLWDLQGNHIFTMQGHTVEIAFVAFTSSEFCVISGSKDGEIKLWDFNANLSRQLVDDFFISDPSCLTISANGQYFLAQSYNKGAKLWDQEGNEIQAFLNGHDSFIKAVAISPNGKYVLTGSNDKTVKLWDLKGNILHTLQGHEKGLVAVEFSPNGLYILTASDSLFKIWDLKGNDIFSIKVQQITAAAFSPCGRYVLTGSIDETAKLWDLKKMKSISFVGHTAYVSAVAFSLDGQYILTGSGDLTAKLWNINGNELVTFTGHSNSITSVDISPDGQYILTGSWDETAKLWDRTGNEIQNLFIGNGTIHKVGFSPDGKFIYTGSKSNPNGGPYGSIRVMMSPMNYLSNGSIEKYPIGFLKVQGMNFNEEDLQFRNKRESESLNKAKSNFEKIASRESTYPSLKYVNALSHLYEISEALNEEFDFKLFFDLDGSNELRAAGTFLFKKKEWDKARQLYEKLLLLEDSPRNRLNLYLANAELGQSSFSKLFLTESITQIKEYINFLHHEILGNKPHHEILNLSRLLVLLCNHALSLQDNPEDRFTYAQHINGYGWFQLLDKNYEDCEKTILRALEVSPDYEVPYTNLAAALLFQGKYNEALDIYKKFKNKRWTANRQYKTFTDAFLDDFKSFEFKGIISSIRKADVEKIKVLLKNDISL